ncbi:MAG: hypothetical protein M1831_000818 [Alyxoria varia]|nr:MAG: hypothetical protein M1831_000818 [Alyxoria varia]
MPNFSGFLKDQRKRSSNSGSNATTESAYERRRAQVRKAQRNHRERKENYIKALEAEVVKLRKQNQTDAHDLAVLEQALRSFNIPVPARSRRLSNDPSPESSVVSLGAKPTLHICKPGGKGSQALQIASVSPSQSYTGTTSQQPYQSLNQTASNDLSGLEVGSNQRNTAGGFASGFAGAPGFGESDLNSFMPTGSEAGALSPGQGMQPTDLRSTSVRPSVSNASAASPAFSQADAFFKTPSPRQNASSAASSPPQGAMTPTPANNYLNNPSLIAMDFVLSLEHPCMGHADETRKGTGAHTHMASHQVMYNAPPDLSGAANWSVPNADIDKLLALAGTFQLKGEITPVQAWYRLITHPKCGQMAQQPGWIQRFKEQISRDMKCYGFGAVLDEQIFEIGLEELFEDQSHDHGGLQLMPGVAY